jgi:beta-glucanase (GH16 family)
MVHSPAVIDDGGQAPSAAAGGASATDPAEPPINAPVAGTGGSLEEPGELPVDASGWKLVCADEFDGPEIDPGKWTLEENCWGGGNAELQCYVADGKNSFIQDGALHIVALADSPSGTIGGPENNQEVVNMPYSSARLITRGKAGFKYGRFEARLKLPVGQGLWPAFWMLPTEDIYGGWAASGEIDIMEAINTSPSANYVYGTLHYGGVWPQNSHTGDAYEPPSNVWETFFTYAVEWEEGAIHWFVDDVHYLTQTEWHTQNAPFPAPFDQNFFLILNVAVGGNWPGSPDASTSFPQEMIVDYVRAFECTHDPLTGHGCTN